MKKLLIVLSILLVPFVVFSQDQTPNEKLNSQLSSFQVIEKTAYLSITNYSSDFQLYKEFIILRTSRIKKVVLYMNCGGGSVIDFLSFINVLNINKPYFEITAIASGIVASMAVPLYLVVPERYATRDTIFMLHPIKGMFRGMENVMDMETIALLIKNWTKRYNDIIVDNSNLTQEQVDGYLLTAGDKYFTVDEAVEMGFVHKIIQ